MKNIITEEEKVQYLLQHDFYPFTPENFGEALAQMSHEAVERLSELAEKRVKQPIEPYHAIALGDALCREVRMYWLKMARHKVQKKVEL